MVAGILRACATELKRNSSGARRDEERFSNSCFLNFFRMKIKGKQLGVYSQMDSELLADDHCLAESEAAADPPGPLKPGGRS